MKLNKKQLDLKIGLEKEWIITNGIGGYSSTTVIGANTRKYHGLLVAPLTPPARRFLILSKLDESITIGEEKYDLYTNVCKNYISDGYKYLESFEKEYLPIFTYKVKDVIIKKIICMEYGKNTVCVFYKMKNGNKRAKLTLAPIVNFRDFHSMNTNHIFNIKQELLDKKLKVIIDKNISNPVYMYITDGKYIQHSNDIFKNMYYIEEEKRGFFPEENHSVVGRYEIDLEPDQEKELGFICSLEENIEEINVRQIIDNEITRLSEIIYNSQLIKTKGKKEELVKNNVIRDYIIATDNFVVYRPNFGLHTIIAGYPWFLDWGRDALISFEGLLLITKRFEIAKEVLLTYTRDIKYGLVPNGYSGFDNRPLYNSVDASLLLFEQINKYLKYTSDYKFIKDNIYQKLIKIIESYKFGIGFDDNNIYLDRDFLISSGTKDTQNTWMDAKYGELVITPRNGKAVEINAMWYNSLKIMEQLCLIYEDKELSEEYRDLAIKCRKSFGMKFYNPTRHCLYDVIEDPKIRPNQLFALGLSYPIIEPNSEIAKEVFETVTKKLLNKYGLKTLAKGEKNYIEVYEGDGFKRDMSYHQGITWTWLLGIYIDAFKNIVDSQKNKNKKKILQEEYKKFIDKIETTFNKSLYNDKMVGSISELYDSRSPQLPKGAPAQAWSVAEIFRIIINR